MIEEVDEEMRYERGQPLALPPSDGGVPGGPPVFDYSDGNALRVTLHQSDRAGAQPSRGSYSQMGNEFRQESESEGRSEPRERHQWTFPDDPFNGGRAFVSGEGSHLGDQNSELPPFYPFLREQSIYRVWSDRWVEFPLVFNDIGHFLAFFRDCCVPNLWVLNRISDILRSRNIRVLGHGLFRRDPQSRRLGRVYDNELPGPLILRTFLVEDCQILRVWQERPSES